MLYVSRFIIENIWDDKLGFYEVKTKRETKDVKC